MTRLNLVEARKRRSGEIQSHRRSCCACRHWFFGGWQLHPGAVHRHSLTHSYPPPLLLPLQEKKGSPLFMPLMNERGVEAVAVGTKGPDANAV